MDYKIIYVHNRKRSDAVDFLTKEVQKHIGIGWQPQGGVSIATEVYDGELWYTVCQAMVYCLPSNGKREVKTRK